MSQKVALSATLSTDLKGLRLDQALAQTFPDYSRTQLQTWIDEKKILVDGREASRRLKVSGGEAVTIQAELKTQPAWQAQAIALTIIYEDDAILVINKPAGMVVHPAAGNPDQTLLNAVLHHAPALKDLPRAGIVHRLDKDTSGILIIAKTAGALTHLTKQIKKRTMRREYQTIVQGILTSGGTVDAPMDRHPIHRKRMAVIETGKTAVTHYRVMEKYRHHCRLKVQLETGRTHQIRVHMLHIHHAILGDRTYGKRLQLPKGASPELVTVLQQFKRQALHAFRLEITHPITQKLIAWEAELPEDMKQLIAALKKDHLANG